MPDSPLSPDLTPSIEQQIKGDRNVTFTEAVKSTIMIPSDGGQVNNNYNYHFSPEGQPQSEKRKIPSLLPYLPNRRQQEEELAEAINDCLNRVPSKPLVCVIHGDEFQSHDQFLERLKKLSFPKYMGLDSKQMSIKDYELTWPSELKKLDNLESQFCKDLAEKLLKRNSATWEEINQVFCEYPAPVIIRTHLLTEDWQNQGFIILDRLLQFWQKWPDLIPEKKLIVCLSIKYQVNHSNNGNRSILTWFFSYWRNYFRRKRYQFINKKIHEQLESFSRDNFQQFNRLSGIVLPELTGISRSHVENWARNEATDFVGEEMIGKLVEEIGTIFRNWENEKSSSTIPMSLLADKLINLLEKLTVNNRGIL